MTQFNPITGSIIQSQQLQRQQPLEKARQIQREQKLTQNSAAHDDLFQHQVESTEKVDPLHDEEPHHEQQQRKQRRRSTPELPSTDDDAPRLDITA